MYPVFGGVHVGYFAAIDFTPSKMIFWIVCGSWLYGIKVNELLGSGCVSIQASSAARNLSCVGGIVELAFDRHHPPTVLNHLHYK